MLLLLGFLLKATGLFSRKVILTWFVITPFVLAGAHAATRKITGLAQVNGQRGETASLERMYQRVQFDLEYLKNWSLGLDLRILLKTVFIVLRDRSAY